MNRLNKLLVLASALGLLAAGTTLAEDATVGAREFRNHCAGCHGLDGAGNGPLVEFLKQKPKPLTTLSRENNGEFPFQRVYDVIDGTSMAKPHGTSDMPVWGDRYATEIIEQYGEFGTSHPQTVRCRILELVFYLAGVQER